MGFIFNFLEDVAWNMGNMPGKLASNIQVAGSNLRSGSVSEEESQEALERLKAKGLYIEPTFNQEKEEDNSASIEDIIKEAEEILKNIPDGDETDNKEKEKTNKKNTNKKPSPQTPVSEKSKYNNNGGCFCKEVDGKLEFTMLHQILNDEADPLYYKAMAFDMSLLAMINDPEIGSKYVDSDEYKNWLQVKSLMESRNTPQQTATVNKEGKDEENKCPPKTNESDPKEEKEKTTKVQPPKPPADLDNNGAEPHNQTPKTKEEATEETRKEEKPKKDVTNNPLEAEMASNIQEVVNELKKTKENIRQPEKDGCVNVFDD